MNKKKKKNITIFDRILRADTGVGRIFSAEPERCAPDKIYNDVICFYRRIVFRVDGRRFQHRDRIDFTTNELSQQRRSKRRPVRDVFFFLSGHGTKQCLHGRATILRYFSSVGVTPPHISRGTRVYTTTVQPGLWPRRSIIRRAQRHQTALIILRKNTSRNTTRARVGARILLL